MVGSLLLVPFTGGLSAAAAASAVAAGAVGGATMGGVTGAIGAEATKEDLGLPEDFVNTMSASLKPNGSAIFAVVESHDPEQIAQYFRGTGGQIITTTLTPWQQERIQHILAGSR